MFSMEAPWWEFIARAAIVYVALLVMVRVSGKRTISQYTPFDLLVVVLLSESVSSSLTGDDKSIQGGLILAATLIALNMAAALIASRSTKAERLLEGSPVLLGRDGKWYENVLKAQRVGQSELESALREADCKLEDMAYAVLEANGVIAISKKPTAGLQASQG
ncbi:MAG TPA: YetF domain-containing protein [Candidimonas sp.]|nr:YetF domain-containing protein [Candidimonas sp.]